MTRPPLVSVIAPVYNEAEVVRELHGRIARVADGLKRFRFEMVYVDDGSTDRTLDALKTLHVDDPRVRVVELRRNFGQTPALSAGLDHAHGDILITMDADLQHFPEDIPRFLEGIEEGADLVCGWRKSRREGVSRRLPSWIANRVIRWISGLRIHDFGTTYRAYRRDILQDLSLFGELHRFIPALAHLGGWRIREIPIKNIARPAGKSNYGLSRTFGVFLDLLFLLYYLRYLTCPMRAFGKLAALLFIPGFGISATLLGLAWSGAIRTVRDHDAMLLLSVLLMLLGTQFLAVGILAEMINRIYLKASSKALYRVRQVWEAKDA
jgi:glycosyltransferase involved in cell wall biosynthesis